MFARFIIPTVVAVAIACGVIARHNTEAWQRFYGQAQEFYSEGRYDACLEAASRSLGHAEGWLGLSARHKADSLNLIALSLDEFERYEEAEAAYLRALELEERAWGRQGNPDYALLLNNFALSCNGQGRYEQAVVLAQEAFEIREQLGRIDRGHSLLALVSAMGGLEDYAQLVNYAQQAAAVYENGLPDYADELATALHWEGDGLYVLDQYAQAEAPLLRALAIYREIDPWESIVVGDCLADVYLALGRVGQAEEQYLQMLAFLEGLAAAQVQDAAEAGEGGSGSVADGWLVWALTRSANFYAGTDQHDKAVPQYRRAVELNERIYGGEHYHLVSSLNDLGIASEALGEYAQAQTAYLQALAILEGWEEQNTDMLFVVLQNLRDSYEKSGHLQRMAEVGQRMHGLTEAEAATIGADAAGVVAAEAENAGAGVN